MTDEQREFEDARARIIRRTRKVVAECEQAIRDIHSWNDNQRPAGCTPLDPEPWVVAGHVARRIHRLATDRQDIPDGLVERMAAALAD